MKKLMSVISLTALLLTPVLDITYAFSSPITIKLTNTKYVGNKTSIPFSVNNSYQVVGTGVTLAKDVSYTIQNVNNEIAVYNGTTQLVKGATLKFSPAAYTYDNYVTLSKGSTGQRNYLGDIEFKPEAGYVRPYNTLELEDYLKGVVPEEMSNSWGASGGLEALKTQAVAARTYAIRYVGTTINDTESYQVYGGYNSTYSSANTAVDATKNQTVTYNKAYISAVFSSSNGGYIESNTGAWGSAPLAYLPAKPDKFDPVNAFTYSITEANLLANTTLMGRVQGKINNQQVKGINSITLKELTDGQRPKYLTFNVVTSTGTTESADVLTSDVRLDLGASLIKSTYIKGITKSNGTFTFNGAGFGHGVGMSQWGALKMSQLGYDYKNILGYYYPNTELKTGSVYQALVFQDKDPSVTEPTPAPTPIPELTYNYNAVFNEPALTVTFEAPASGNIDIILKDGNGQTVKTLKERAWESAGTKTYQYSNLGLDGNYKVSLRYANGDVVKNFDKDVILSYDTPKFTSAQATVNAQNISLNYAIDKKGYVLIEVVDKEGNRMVVAEPYEQKEPGSYTLNQTLSQLNGDYTVRFAVYNAKGKVTDVKEKAISITGNIPEFSDKIKTAGVIQQVTVYDDALQVNRQATVYENETLKVLRNVENTNIYEVEYNGKTGFVNASALNVEKRPSIEIAINGYDLMMDTNPVVKNQRTLVPARWVASGLGFDSIVWDGTNQKAVMKKGTKTIELPFGKNYAYVDGKKVTLDTTIQAVDGRLLVPLRFVSEQIGAQVSWDGNHNMIWLKK